MSYKHYLNLKKSGPNTQFLIKDSGVKMFPVVINMRKFIHAGINHFTELNISFDILFNIENYYTISCNFVHSTHHQSHLSSHYKKQKPKFVIRCEPLYEYGNEEEHLPTSDMLHIVKNEKDILDVVTQAILIYEKEQNIEILKSYIQYWRQMKRNIAKIDAQQYMAEEDLYNWKRFFHLCTKNKNLLELESTEKDTL